jgi:hypothetical protein
MAKSLGTEIVEHVRYVAASDVRIGNVRVFCLSSQAVLHLFAICLHDFQGPIT